MRINWAGIGLERSGRIRTQSSDALESTLLGVSVRMFKLQTNDWSYPRHRSGCVFLWTQQSKRPETGTVEPRWSRDIPET